MCSTCNYKEYEEYEVPIPGNKTEKRLKIKNPFLDINCDITGKNFRIGNFVIYRCPTCGRKLYK